MSNDNYAHIDMDRPYTPTRTDLAFTRGVIASIRSGGSWAVPREGTIYQINQETKTFTLLVGKPGPDYHALKSVLPALGWSLVGPKEGKI